VQAHLRHTNIHTTTRYTRLTQTELKEVVGVFDGDENEVVQSRHGGIENSQAKITNTINLVAQRIRARVPEPPHAFARNHRIAAS
jgi:hypothetical protein